MPEKVTVAYQVEADDPQGIEAFRSPGVDGETVLH